MGRRAGITAEETKDQLLKAAVRVFSARGYEGSRVSEIASEAGLSTGAIYAHYRDKASLLCAAIRAGGPKELAGLVESGGSGSVVGMLRVLGSRLGRSRADGRAGRTRAILIESLAASRRDPRIGDVLRESIERRETALAELVRRGQDAGEVARAASPEAVARLCMLLVLGTVVTRQLELSAPPADGWDAVITSLVHNLESVESR